MRHRNLIVGALLIALSFLSFSLQLSSGGKLFLGAILYLGVIYVSEWITSTLAKQSLLSHIRRSRHNTVVFVAVAAVGGLLLDGVAKILGKLWVYPLWTPTFYALIFIPGFAMYWLTITESYLASKAVLDVLSRGRKSVTKPYKNEWLFYWFIGAAGMVVVALTMLLFMRDFAAQRLPLMRPENVYSSAPSYKIPFSYSIFLLLGTWMFLEWIEFVRKRTSLVRDLAHRYYTPLIAIIIGSCITAALMEAQNIPAGLWRYSGWPLAQVMIGNIPILAFIVWPLQYVMFLSLFRALTAKESRAVWQGDRIS